MGATSGNTRPRKKWMADAFRLVWSIIYWNTRKTVFVVRGRRGRAPCQNPSDDCIPGEVRCDAVLMWDSPARFRPICPLLVHTANGWCCSVAPQSVRSFWGRALGWFTVGALALYLIGGTAFFVGLRSVGRAPVTWAQVLWPGKWHEIRTVQSEALFGRAMEAFVAGRLNEAFLALSSARQRDPGNYRSGLLLAQLTMFQGSFLFADDVYAELLRDHPAERFQTAVHYHDTLLAMNRLDRLAGHCAAMAHADPQHAAVWVRSLLVAVRARGNGAEFLQHQAEAVERLAPFAQFLLRAEAMLGRGERTTAIRQLAAPFRGPLNPIYMQAQVERLAESGAPLEAHALLDFYGPALGEFEQVRTRWKIDLLTGEEWAVAASFRALLAQNLTAGQVERLALVLIEHPSAARFRELHQYVLRSAAVAAAVSGPALWITGLVCGAPEEAVVWQQRGVQPLGERYPDVSTIDLQSRRILQTNSVVHVANAITLPREFVLTLFSRPFATPVAQR
ncbi:MAG: hypothetical protein Q8M02_10145 [Candidatus Didemnitutus sp.]|nr:hypothetical protein [Candidatus Didemnitutus sp.]